MFPRVRGPHGRVFVRGVEFSRIWRPGIPLFHRSVIPSEARLGPRNRIANAGSALYAGGEPRDLLLFFAGGSRKPALSEDRGCDRSRMGTCICSSPEMTCSSTSSLLHSFTHSLPHRAGVPCPSFAWLGSPLPVPCSLVPLLPCSLVLLFPCSLPYSSLFFHQFPSLTRRRL
jgi:hypothetical protein